jgi:hypothetical protein
MPHAPRLLNPILKAETQVLVDVLAYVVGVEMHTPKVLCQKPSECRLARAG